MSDYNKFLSETQRFVAELETVAPEIASRQPERVRIILQDIRSRHNARVMKAKSHTALVGELRVLCSVVPKKRISDLMPAINRYVNILENINLDSTEEIELQRAISLLLNDFATADWGSVEVMAEPVVEFKSALRSAKPKISGRAAFRDSKVMAYSDILPAGGTQPPEQTLRVRLSGDKVKGRTVERGANCVLSVDWGVPDGTTIGEFIGNELRRAREAKLEVVFVLYRGLFEVEGNRTRIATRFNDDGFEKPVTYKLTAPSSLASPSVKTSLYLEIEIHGHPAVRVRVQLTVVQNLVSVPEDAPTMPVRIDLDKLIANAMRSPPVATLRIISSAVSSAELEITETGQVYKSNAGISDALTQTSIAIQLGTIAAHMNDVAQNQVWNILANPLKPTANELQWLSNPLAVAAAAGSKLHEWLSMTAGMKDILSRIETFEIGSRITVRSDGVAIPWETIYPVEYRVHQSNGNYESAVDHTKFWGYRFEFETIMCPGQRELPEGDTDLTEQHRNAVRKLTAVMNTEIDSDAVVKGKPWKAGPPVDYQIQKFGKALADIQIKRECSEARKLVEMEPILGPFVYFYCHGSASKPFDPDVAVLQISKQCNIAVDEVKYAPTFIDAPIVFLNSCSSGPLASISFDTFCARFLHKGALGLITTSFGVPAPFAARFGCELIIRYMKADETLGQILLDMRRKALDQRIPIGLFYMLRCPASISLKSD